MRLHSTLQMQGPALDSQGLPASIIHELLGVLVEGAQRALRYRLLGRSTGRGQQPGWLREAARFDLEQVSVGPLALLSFGSPSLDEVLPEQQLAGSRGEFGRRSALDLFEEGLEDALGGRADSERFDEGLVHTFGRLSQVLEQGISSLCFVNGRDLVVDSEGLQRIRQLERQIPPPRAVQVAGKVDAIRHSDRVFTLVLQSGVTLRGVAEQVEPEQLVALFGQVALVGGMAVFRPSGAVQHIEAEWLRPATDAEAVLWNQVPRPLFGPLPVHMLRVPQGPHTGIHAIVGQWPGDESDEYMQAELERMS